jgi:iron complex transport system ATP-binding protein
VSLSLDRGDFLSILGPNGAGKSTFLKCLMRLNERGRARGAVEIAGGDLASYGQKRLARLVSYVPQAGGWIPPFTVRDFARLSRYPYATAVSGLTAADERAVDRALELTGLAPLARRSLKTLSGGERQKAYLAAALAQETEIMLLDEPAASLDPRHASELAALLRELNRVKGLTMLMITHDLNHPLRAGCQALVLRAGRRLYFGPVEGLLDRGILEAAFDHRFLYLDHPSGIGRVVLAE